MLCVTAPATGIRRARVVRAGRLEEHADVAPGREADAQRIGLARGVDHLYSLLASKPLRRQICVASGVPGKGLPASHRAQAQSAGAISVSPITSPRVDSAVRITRRDWRGSRLTGL
jgi:hypothetical protein